MTLSTDHNRPVVMLDRYLPLRSDENKGKSVLWRSHVSGTGLFKSWSTETDGDEHCPVAIVELINGEIQTPVASTIVFTDKKAVSQNFDSKKFTYEELVSLGVIE